MEPLEPLEPLDPWELWSLALHSIEYTRAPRSYSRGTTDRLAAGCTRRTPIDRTSDNATSHPCLQSLHAVDAAIRTRARTPDTSNSPNSPSTDPTAPPSASPRLSPWNGAQGKSIRTIPSQRECSSRRPPPANSARARSRTNPSLSSMKRPEWKEEGFLECRESPRF